MALLNRPDLAGLLLHCSTGQAATWAVYRDRIKKMPPIRKQGRLHLVKKSGGLQRFSGPNKDIYFGRRVLPNEKFSPQKNQGGIHRIEARPKSVTSGTSQFPRFIGYSRSQKVLFNNCGHPNTKIFVFYTCLSPKSPSGAVDASGNTVPVPAKLQTA